MIKTAYEIITWIFDDNQKANYKGILVEPFTKRQDVAEQLQALRRETTGNGDFRLDTFLSKVDVFSMTTPYDISREIDDNNERWKNEIITELDTATSRDDLGTVQQEFDANKEMYEDDTVEEIQQRLFETAEQVRGIERARDDIFALRQDIQRAESPEDLPDISMGELERRYGKTTKDELADLFYEKTNELESLEEKAIREIRSEINTANTIEDLRGIDTSRVPTEQAEDALRAEIQDKIRGLS